MCPKKAKARGSAPFRPAFQYFLQPLLRCSHRRSNHDHHCNLRKEVPEMHVKACCHCVRDSDAETYTAHMFFLVFLRVKGASQALRPLRDPQFAGHMFSLCLSPTLSATASRGSSLEAHMFFAHASSMFWPASWYQEHLLFPCLSGGKPCRKTAAWHSPGHYRDLEWPSKSDCNLRHLLKTQFSYLNPRPPGSTFAHGSALASPSSFLEAWC